MAGHHIDPKETILFAGAGVSMNLKLPSWEALVGKIGKNVGYDPDIFKTLSHPLALAEFYHLKKGTLLKLERLLDAEWHSRRIKIRKSKVHREIVRLKFPRIYTTNFDRWIEKSFESQKIKYHKIVNVKDVVGVKKGIVDIIKFHGDFDEQNSLILTESSYFRRMEFEDPLDLLLRADALHSSILFIGYSLSDVNIRYLFYKLSQLWRDPKVKPFRKPSYIFMSRPNPIEQEIFLNWGITPIVDPIGGETGLLSFLRSLK